MRHLFVAKFFEPSYAKALTNHFERPDPCGVVLALGDTKGRFSVIRTGLFFLSHGLAIRRLSISDAGLRRCKAWRGYVGPSKDGALGRRGNYHRHAALGVFLVPQLTASPQRQRLKPPVSLNKAERAVWEEVVNSTDPQHFKRCESPLLATYTTAVVMARYYSHLVGAPEDTGNFHANWIQNARLVTSLSSRLRLSPSSRYDARAAERHSNAPTENPPWED